MDVRGTSSSGDEAPRSASTNVNACDCLIDACDCAALGCRIEVVSQGAQM
jgi:hypothetical protein